MKKTMTWGVIEPRTTNIVEDDKTKTTIRLNEDLDIEIIIEDKTEDDESRNLA